MAVASNSGLQPERGRQSARGSLPRVAVCHAVCLRSPHALQLLSCKANGYRIFSGRTGNIVEGNLSRENTNVRSLAISLDQKRKALSLCLDALQGLQQEIAGEPTPVTPSNPRKMGPTPSTAH